MLLLERPRTNHSVRERKVYQNLLGVRCFTALLGRIPWNYPVWGRRFARATPVLYFLYLIYFLYFLYFIASTIIAIPCPPPMHAVANPYRKPFRRSSFTSVITTRVPLAPSGCPSAIAPPFTLVLSRFSPNTFSTARYCAANAPFTSTRSICSSFSPASFSAFCEDGTGPIPIMLSSHPPPAHDTMRPIGFNPRSFAIFSRVTTTAAPPSTIPLAFPAVTIPSFLNDGVNFSSVSIVVSGRRWSSSLTKLVFFPCFTSTGTSSSLILHALSA